MAFEHLVITRFNLPYLRGGRHLDEAWLDYRFGLFERFCAASMRAQSCRRFRWLVLLDARTPHCARARLERIGLRCNLEPVYLDEFRPDAVTLAIQGRLAHGTSHVISTTLDSDDGLARDFVAAVQAEYRGQAFELLNFPNGYRLMLGRARLHECVQASNPFVSAIEQRDGAKTVYGYLPHSTLAERFPIRDVASPPMWLQVVHGDNLAPTGVYGRRRVPLRRLSERFDADVAQTAPEHPAAMLLENVRRRGERAVLDRLGPRIKHRLARLLRR